MKRGIETSLYFQRADLELTDERAAMMGQSRSDVVHEALMALHGPQAIARKWEDIMRRERVKGGVE